MIDQVKASECCGCKACMDACSHGAISFKEGTDGFQYPKLDQERCIQCGLCIKTCPILNRESPAEPIASNVLAAQCKDRTVRSNSSSGGIFSVLARMVLEKGGVVYGAALDGQMQLRHVKAEDCEGLSGLMGSKYIQSDTTGIYQSVKEQLLAGRQVLFSGTPCQVRALRLFLRKPFDNLLTVDVVCHGVPSQASFDRYRSTLEKKKGARITGTNFRSKASGWKSFSVEISYANGNRTLAEHHQDMFMRGFLANHNLRRSCYHCPANHYRSGSDLTLGDFWSYVHEHGRFDGDEGVSAVIIHTEQGRKALQKCEAAFDAENQELSRLVACNHVLEKSVEQPSNRDAYLALVMTGKFEKADDLYICRTTRERIKKRIYRLKKG